MTLAALMPYILFGLGWLARHYDLLGRVVNLLGGSNPLAEPVTPAKLPLPAVRLGNHPVVSDAVNAAIQQAVADIFAGHVVSVKGELEAAARAAVEKAISDLKAKA